jgi:hypothetical protein
MLCLLRAGKGLFVYDADSKKSVQIDNLVQGMCDILDQLISSKTLQSMTDT